VGTIFLSIAIVFVFLLSLLGNVVKWDRIHWLRMNREQFSDLLYNQARKVMSNFI